MLYIILIVCIIILLFVVIMSLFSIDLKVGKYDIRFSTFLKKGLKRIDDRFGVWFITGKQGSNKSYFATYLLTRQSPNLCNKVFTNVKSLKNSNFNIEYFDTISELYTNTDEYCIFIIDEVSRRYDKNSRTDTQFYAWLNQSRKRKRIVILITQEWRELPMWLRRPAKYMFTSKPTRLLSIFGIYTCTLGDAENLVFDKDEGEYNCPTLKQIYYRRNKKIADMYDTFEAINIL